MASFSIEQALTALQDTTHCSYKIRCEDEVFHCHKEILRLKSSFLATSIDGSFAEAEKETLNIGEAKAWHVGLAVVWIYTKNLELDTARRAWPDKSCFSKKELNAMELLELYEVATRMMLVDLQEVVARSFFAESKLDNMAIIMNMKSEELTTHIANIFRITLASDNFIRPVVIAEIARTCKSNLKVPSKVVELMETNDYQAWKTALQCWKRR